MVDRVKLGKFLMEKREVLGSATVPHKNLFEDLLFKKAFKILPQDKSFCK